MNRSIHSGAVHEESPKRVRQNQHRGRPEQKNVAAASSSEYCLAYQSQLASRQSNQVTNVKALSK